MSNARAEILARIRATQRADPPPTERDYRRRGALSRAERLARFCERVSDYRAEVRRVAPEHLSAAIAEACAGRRIGIPPGLHDEWRAASCNLVADTGLSPAELDHLDGVLTGCTAAIAETGTIVLAHGPTEGRRALTLVPDLHICIVREDQIVETVPEALAAVSALVRNEQRPLTLVSGPSATSDIELSRVEGVHGPRTLVVLVVNG
ncbi:MAG: LutC/YkgG family protein [Acidimicrobiales bacterium]